MLFKKSRIDKIIDWLLQFTSNKRYIMDSVPIPKEPSFIIFPEATQEDLNYLATRWKRTKIAEGSILLREMPTWRGMTDLEKEEVKPMTAKFELFQGADEQWYFNLKANNGKVIAQSEGYRRRTGALKGIAAIKKVAREAKIIETDY